MNSVPDRPRRPDEMICQRVVELFTDYLEGALLADDRARVDEHLSWCAGCIDYLTQMRATIATLGDVQAPLARRASDRSLELYRRFLRDSP